MIRTGKVGGWLFACLCVSGLFAAETLAADEIQLIAGSTIKAVGGRLRGRIDSESPTEVKIEATGGGMQTVPVSQIASIKYDGQPASLNLAETREANGNLPEAAELYQKAAAESSDKPFAAQKALFGRARVLAELGLTDANTLKEAVRTLTSFKATYAKSRFGPAALELLASLEIRQNDLALASKTADELGAIEGFGDNGKLLSARIDAKKGNLDKALATAEAVAASAPKGSDVQRSAVLIKAEALAGLKKYKEAETAVREVLKAAAAEDAKTQALAYNTLGDCLTAAGKKQDAIEAYLHTDILFFKNRDEHPRALARLVKLFHETKREDRALECLDRLKQDYPQSPWLADAQASEEK